MNYKADIGVFGGSGFYSFLDGVEEIDIETPYGKPSDKIAIATINGKKVAFLPRHGKHHSLPPHKVPYKANIYAMKMLGVKALISPCSCGSLQKDIKPGDFVICDQFIDRTYGREITFFEGLEVKHISAADPYDEKLRQIAIESAKEIGITCHERGTIVVIQGPRFSTKAESKWFTDMGWHVVNMTQFPEGYLAMEQEIPTVNVSLVTDYDAGLVAEENIEPVTMEEVFKVLNDNIERVKALIYKMIEKIEV
ncbi:MAG: S-methyl-5'-thioadenosine phosphorylase [Clostridiales bacterium]|nr:S-methyl-5'-thioadenosine phosphorylase [Clostridiales bacterium]